MRFGLCKNEVVVEQDRVSFQPRELVLAHSLQVTFEQEFPAFAFQIQLDMLLHFFA